MNKDKASNIRNTTVTARPTSTLRQRKDRSPPATHHVILSRDNVILGQGGQPLGGEAACWGGGVSPEGGSVGGGRGQKVEG